MSNALPTLRRLHKTCSGGHVHQPPGGVSHLGGVATIGQGSPEDDDKQSKRAAMHAYQEELKKQVFILVYLIMTFIIWLDYFLNSNWLACGISTPVTDRY